MFEDLIKPTLVLDETKTRNNIKKIFDKIKYSKKIFRPHFKTHQSKDIGNWFKQLGVDKITVSSVDMARYFSRDFSDITIAIPVNLRQITEINEVASNTKLNLLLENIYSAQVLDNGLARETDVFIEIDVDYGRSGIYWKNIDEIITLASFIKESKKLRLAGILTHAGQTYNAKNTSEIKRIFHETTEKMHTVRKQLHTSGFANILVSVGDTPSISLIDNFNGVDELRPGNFVFYDLMQSSFGVCTEDEISIAVACPVISKYPSRNEIVIYGGAVHLSKEFYEILSENTGTIKCFGKVALPMNDHWSKTLEGVYVKSLSQEHGVVSFPTKGLLDEITVGDIIFIIPVHSCLTSNLYPNFITLEGLRLNTMHSF